MQLSSFNALRLLNGLDIQIGTSWNIEKIYTKPVLTQQDLTVMVKLKEKKYM